MPSDQQLDLAPSVAPVHPSGPIRVLGVIGAGKSGIAIARRALAAGYRVQIATSRAAAETAFVTSILLPAATALDVEEISTGADAVVLALPLRRFGELPVDRLAGRIVIDVMNYWPPVDGTLPQFDDPARTSSETIRDALPSSVRLVKALNHIGYHDIEDLARPAGAPGRIALGLAGDNHEALDAVAHLIDDLGFDPVTLGSLAASGALQPGSPAFGANLSRNELRETLAAAGETLH